MSHEPRATTGWFSPLDRNGAVKEANSPGPVALPGRLVSRIGRPLDGEGTKRAAQKARDRGR